MNRPLLAFAGALAAASLPAQGAQILFANPWSNAATVSSHVWSSPLADVEAADDFDVHGTITRVVVDGSGCSSCAPPAVAGATVRFYDWNNGTPGALLQQAFVPAPSPALRYTPAEPRTIDIDLPRPFFASGRHFVSVQLHFQGAGTWNIWVGNWGNPTLSPVLVRDRLGLNQWQTPNVYPWPSAQVLGDLTLQLWGVPAGSSGQPAVPCSTWSPLPPDGPANHSHCLLRDVKMFAVDEVWAAGTARVPLGGYTVTSTYVARWNGAAWTQVPSPSPAPVPALTNCNLYAIDGALPNDLWVGGSYNTQVNGGWVGQQVLLMHWDGRAWTLPANLPLPNTSTGAGISGSRVLDIEAIAASDVWFVGDWLDLLSPANPQTIRPGLLLHWDGNNLQQTLLPVVTGVGHQYFNAIDASSSNDVWAVGGAGVAGNLPGSTVPVVFQFDGSNWTHRPFAGAPPGVLNLYAVEALAPNDVYVFGTATVNLPLPQTTRFVAHWDGSSFALLPGPPAGGAVAVLAANDMWSVGGEVWHFDGVAWTRPAAFTGLDASLGAVDALGPCLLFGVGGQTRQGLVAPFAARLDHGQLWHSRQRVALQPDQTPGVLTALSAVRPGGVLRVGLADPSGALTVAQAPTMWFASLHPLPSGVVLPFGGRGGGPGALLVDPGSIGLVSGPVNLPAGTGPAVHSVAIPLAPALVGLDLASQGLLLDTGPGMRALFSNALDLQVGW